jgi:hypothetical protein
LADEVINILWNSVLTCTGMPFVPLTLCSCIGRLGNSFCVEFLIQRESPSLINEFTYNIPEIPDFLTEYECQQLIDQATRLGLETSPFHELGNNFEPTNQETFGGWDYNEDNAISPQEVN